LIEYGHFGPQQVQSTAIFSNTGQVYLCMFVQANTNPNLNTVRKNCRIEIIDDQDWLTLLKSLV